MSVSPQVRAAEAEIDRYIESLPIWSSSRSKLVHAVLRFYCDGASFMPGMAVAGAALGMEEAVPTALALEGMLHAGVFQAMKWSLLFGVEQDGPDLSAQDVFELIQLGAKYEALVDVLRQAKNGLVSIEADPTDKRLLVYEGGDKTGFDRQLIEEQRLRKPLLFHFPLTEDSDQLTRQWTAGEFRNLGRLIPGLAPEEEGLVFGGVEIVSPPPPRSKAEAALLRDMTISPAGPSGSWMDTPFVEVDGVLLGVTSILRTVFFGAGDDYMLRLAARVDPDQYSLVSGLREERMIAVCDRELKALGWETETKRKLADPAAEIDVEGTRGGQRLVLELKSTLRPESPAEVRNRNADIVRGIDQVVSLRERLGPGTLGFLVTDGYEGDFSTMAVALAKRVPLVTLQEVREWGQDPRAARVRFLSQEDGRTTGSDPLPDREGSLGPWTMVLIDRAGPAP